jgi:ubiquinone biosynthesis protein
VSKLGAVARILGWGWALVRADALLPREIDPLLPSGVRFAAKSLRLFSAPTRGRRPGQRLAGVLERQGPAAVKFGQLLATRADIFGDVFAGDMTHLKDRLEPFPLDVAKAEIARSLGRDPGFLFAEIGPPVAAASIAQAHPATLNDGRKVAVKVLRPGIEDQVARDSEALFLFARTMERLVPAARRLEPLAAVTTVIRSLELELDLRLEAGGADELRGVMARDPYMTAPAVVWPGVGKRTLTLEWATGRALSEPAALDIPGLDRPAIATKLVRAFLAQALDHGVFHADLHEGNLFVAAPAEIMAVDFGIIGRLSARERLYLAQILWGFITRDYDRVAQAHFDAGYVPSSYSVELFAQALRPVGESVIGKQADTVSMGRLLTQLFEITALFDMHLRPELVLLQKTMVSVEGVGRRLDPNLDIWKASEPIVKAYIARELSPIATTKRHLNDAIAALKAIARIAEREPQAAVVVTPKRGSGLAWFLVGFLTSLLIVGGAAVWAGLIIAANLGIQLAP